MINERSIVRLLSYIKEGYFSKAENQTYPTKSDLQEEFSTDKKRWLSSWPEVLRHCLLTGFVKIDDRFKKQEWLIITQKGLDFLRDYNRDKITINQTRFMWLQTKFNYLLTFATAIIAIVGVLQVMYLYKIGVPILVINLLLITIAFSFLMITIIVLVKK